MRAYRIGADLIIRPDGTVGNRHWKDNRLSPRLTELLPEAVPCTPVWTLYCTLGPRNGEARWWLRCAGDEQHSVSHEGDGEFLLLTIGGGHGTQPERKEMNTEDSHETNLFASGGGRLCL